MTDPRTPGDPTDPAATRAAGGGRSDADDLNVAPDVPGPSGTGEDTEAGGSTAAEPVRGEDGGPQ